MLIDEIADIIIRSDNSGIFTDEQKLDRDYIYALIHKGRARAIFDAFVKTKRISTSWLQQDILDYDADIQLSEDYVIFGCSQTISLDNVRDGLVYVGTIDGNCQYRKLNGRSELAMYSGHRYIKGDDNIRYIYSDGYLEFYGNTELQEVRVDGIFSNPLLLKSFNKDYDNYPISPDLLPTIQEIIFKVDGQFVIGKPIDSKSDSADTLSTPNKK